MLQYLCTYLLTGGSRLPLVAALAAGWLLGLAIPVGHAATFAVNSTADAVDATPGDGVCATTGGTCTLRAAIQEANALAGADTVSLPAGTYILAFNALPITDDLTITGTGAASTTIDGGGIDRVLTIFSSAPPVPVHVTIAKVTIRNGMAGNGGGISNDLSATVNLHESIISGNSAVNGGGIYNSVVGTLTITNSTLSSNSGIHGGGIFNDGNLIITNSTLSGTRVSGAASEGGAIDNHFSGLATISNSTLAGNMAPDGSGGGIFNIVGEVRLTNSTLSDNAALLVGGGLSNLNGTVTLKSTILANTFPGNCSGPMTSAGHNLDSGNTCGFTSPDDLANTDPLLGPLADNGGLTFTQALLPDSPAIDAGSPDCPPPTTDQRGLPRPQGTACDIGAYEFVDTVTILKTVFFNAVSVLFVSAISSAAPEAALFVTVADCLTDAPIQRIRHHYFFLKVVTECGNLDGQTATVTSSFGGAAPATIR